MSLEVAQSYDTSSILQTWNDIGYSQNEQELQQEELNEIIINAIKTYEIKLQETYNSMNEKSNSILESFIQLMKAFGKSDKEIESELSTITDDLKIKQKYEIMNAKFTDFKNANQHIFDKFDQLYSECQKMFDRLEIKAEERGEFGVVCNTDYTNERLVRFEEKFNSLKSEIGNREKVIQSFALESTDISNALEISIPQNLLELYQSKAITNEALETAEAFQKELLLKKETREKELATKLATLHKLWNIFHLPQSERNAFISSFTTIGDKVVQAYDEQILRLKEQREEKLPEIVEQQKEDIQKLERDLNLIDSQIEIIETEGKDLNLVYDLLDQRFEALSSEYNDVKPIIESIQQREELIKENDEIDENARKLEAKQKKKKTQVVVDQKKVAKDEQAKRRIKSLLPRIEKKLLVLLIKYQTQKGREYLWGGEEYIHNLDHIKLSDVELQKAKGIHKKKTPPSSRRTSYFPERPAPVEGGKKHVVRRSLENKPCIGNKKE